MSSYGNMSLNIKLCHLRCDKRYMSDVVCWSCNHMAVHTHYRTQLHTRYIQLKYMRDTKHNTKRTRNTYLGVDTGRCMRAKTQTGCSSHPLSSLSFSVSLTLGILRSCQGAYAQASGSCADVVTRMHLHRRDASTINNGRQHHIRAFIERVVLTLTVVHG